jgi:hypothetical protein
MVNIPCINKLVSKCLYHFRIRSYWSCNCQWPNKHLASCTGFINVLLSVRNANACFVCQECSDELCLSGTPMFTLFVSNTYVGLVVNYVCLEYSCQLCLSGTVMFTLLVRNAHANVVCLEYSCQVCLSGTLMFTLSFRKLMITLSFRNAPAGFVCQERLCLLCLSETLMLSVWSTHANFVRKECFVCQES